MSEIPKLRVGENWFGWLLMLFCLTVLYLAYQIDGFSSIVSSGTFPMGLAAVMVLSMACVLRQNSKCDKPDVDSRADELRQAAKEIFPAKILIYVGLVVLYLSLLEPVGFLPSSFGFLLISMLYFKASSPLKTLLISAGTLAAIYIVFLYVFKVVMP